MKKTEKHAGGRPEKYKPEEVAKALLSTGAIYGQAAAMLGCDTKTIKSYIQKYPICAEAELDANDVVMDLCETELIKQIRAGNMTAIIFYCKTKGKNRGYSERAEIVGKGGGPIIVNILNAEKDL